MTEEQQQIQAFLAQHALEYADIPAIQKAGVVPFLAEMPRRYCVMMPKASRPELGLPDYQLCKGTRMYKGAHGHWHDMRGSIPEGAEMEPLAVTALREGIEELGLELSAISRLLVLGEYHFTSATNRQDVAMWMLAAEMKNDTDFLPLEAIAKTTSAREWLTLAEFQKQGRPDHAHILQMIEQRINHAY